MEHSLTKVRFVSIVFGCRLMRQRKFKITWFCVLFPFIVRSASVYIHLNNIALRLDTHRIVKSGLSGKKKNTLPILVSIWDINKLWTQSNFPRPDLAVFIYIFTDRSQTYLLLSPFVNIILTVSRPSVGHSPVVYTTFFAYVFQIVFRSTRMWNYLLYDGRLII